MNTWIARNIDELTLKTIFNLIDLYPSAKLISVVSIRDNYTIVYNSLNKLSDESTVYVNERLCL
jgi:hypothetical protein